MIIVIMDSQEGEHFQDILGISNHRNQFSPFPLHFEQPLQEEQKCLTPAPKRKGRPKGLKTSREKSQIKKEQRASNKNSGHWVNQQNKRYHWFLQIHSKHFIHKHMRRMDKIFKTMADFIGSREAEQCRSHHQKMQKKHNSFYRIIKCLRREFYLSCDPIYIKQQLHRNNIYQYDTLISEQDLDNERPNLQKQNDEESANQYQHQYQQHLEMEKGSNNNNLFMDNYESRLGML